jgi:hypothetical protein
MTISMIFDHSSIPKTMKSMGNKRQRNDLVEEENKAQKECLSIGENSHVQTDENAGIKQRNGNEESPRARHRILPQHAVRYALPCVALGSSASSSSAGSSTEDLIPCHICAPDGITRSSGFSLMPDDRELRVGEDADEKEHPRKRLGPHFAWPPLNIREMSDDRHGDIGHS